jgi:cell shape-determining protein MreC
MQLQNNLSFFSNSSAENPLFKNVEKQIEKSQKKLDQSQAEYIRLKQLKNEIERQDQKEESPELDADSSEENQD